MIEQTQFVLWELAMLLRMGITGGIGSGKSTLRRMLTEYYDVYAVDADSVAKRAIYTKENKDAIVGIFSGEALLANGGYNMPYIRQEFFGNKPKQERASSFYKSIAQKAVEDEINACPSSARILLLETATLREETTQNRFGLLYIIVAHCNLEIQISRVMNRDNISRDEVQLIVAKQPTLLETKRLKNIILVDTGVSIEEMRQQAEQLYVKLSVIASRS